MQKNSITNDLYKNAFNIMIKAFETENIYNSLYLALKEAKNFTNSDAIMLYKNKNNILNYFLSTKYDNDIINKIIKQYEQQIINTTHYTTITPKNQIINKLSFINIELNNNTKYILLIINNRMKNHKQRKKLAKIYQKTFKTILDKMESLYELKKQSEIDYLTKSGNRISYEKFIKNNKNSFIYILIDLFRLKYVNDNINHAAGDEYIKQVAQLLYKYFPTYTTKLSNSNQTIKINTGNHIFRIGGDEFVLISQFKTKKEIIKQLEKLKKELLQLNISENSSAILGVNYGIVERNNQETLEELYKEADLYLAQDKQLMYKKLKIERRK